MNERLQALAEQAGFIDRGSNHTAYMSFDHEKFAELVVMLTRLRNISELRVPQSRLVAE